MTYQTLPLSIFIFFFCNTYFLGHLTDEFIKKISTLLFKTYNCNCHFSVLKHFWECTMYIFHTFFIFHTWWYNSTRRTGLTWQRSRMIDTRWSIKRLWLSIYLIFHNICKKDENINMLICRWFENLVNITFSSNLKEWNLI